MDKALSKKLQRFTDNTIMNKTALRKELAAIRTRGYGCSNEELDEGVFALAAPLLLDKNTLLGTIAVTGVSDRLRKQFGTEAIAQKIVRASKDLSVMIVNLDIDEQLDLMHDNRANRGR